MDCRAAGQRTGCRAQQERLVNRITLQPKRSRRGGFTLIELMVVISIILILVGVSIAGISQVSKHSKTQRTQTALETARSLMAGYVASDPKQTALKALYDPATVVGRFDTGLGKLLDPTYGSIGAPVGPNGDKRWPGPAIDGNSDKTLAMGIDYTAQVMQLLLRSPENKSIMDKLPAESKFILTDMNGVPLTGFPPLLADGNGEPILFAPPAGMNGVIVNGDNTATLLQSDGRVHKLVADPYPNPLPTPFFASAGSDRSFKTGDDNAYTFHQ